VEREADLFLISIYKTPLVGMDNNIIKSFSAGSAKFGIPMYIEFSIDG
jgi:hypothetical protein